MTELSGATLAYLQTAASAGLVVCLIMAGAFATLGFVASGEQGRRQAAIDTDRLARISELLRETGELAAEPVRLGRPAAEEEVPLVADLAPKAVPDAGMPDVAAVDAEEPASAETPATNARIAALTDALDEALDGAEATDAPSGSDDAPLIPEETMAAIFAAAGPLPDVPPDAAAALSPPPRRLAEREADAIAIALADQAGAFSVEITTAPEPETRLYALQLTGALRAAGIDARGPVAVLTTASDEALLVSAEADGEGPGAILLGALQESGLPALPPNPGTAQADIVAPEGTDVRIYVGQIPAARTPEMTRPSVTTARERVRTLEDA